MENYEKGEVKQVEDVIPFVFEENCIHMNVNNGSKPNNLIGFALKSIKDEKRSQISWFGKGNALYKTISCAQILKSKVKDLHMLCYIRYIRTEEYWEPKNDMLERLKVNVDVPAITILLSKTPVDTVDEFTAPKELQEILNKALFDKKQKTPKNKNSHPSTGVNKQRNKHNYKDKERGTSQTSRDYRNSESDAAVSSFLDDRSETKNVNNTHTDSDKRNGVRHKSRGGGVKYDRGYSDEGVGTRSHHAGYDSKYSNKDKDSNNDRRQESYNNNRGDVSESERQSSAFYEEQGELEHDSTGIGESHQNDNYLHNRTNSERRGRNNRLGGSRSRGNRTFNRNSYHGRDRNVRSDIYERGRNDHSGYSNQPRRGRGNRVSNRGQFRRENSSTFTTDNFSSCISDSEKTTAHGFTDVKSQQTPAGGQNIIEASSEKYENIKEE